MAQDKGPRQEFRVVISGLELPREQQERLASAVQQAALEVFASLDFGGDRAAVAIPLGNGGGTHGGGTTQGIHIVAVARSGLESLVGGKIG